MKSPLRWLPVVLLFTTPAQADGPRDLLGKPDAWFASGEARTTVAAILSHQATSGGWPKNTDTTRPYRGDPAALKPTYDNGATTDELRVLARYHRATGDAGSRQAFERGFDYILAGQYGNGGWPQFHPPGKGYHRHITFNDDAMVRLLRLVREVGAEPGYAFLDEPRRASARAAFDRGIACILACQIRRDGVWTAWCAQHDEIDFRPRPARTFELASLSGSESVGITRLLMSLDKPSPEVVRAVEGAVAWFRQSALPGIRIEECKVPSAPGGKDHVVVADPKAPPLWARFYDLETNRPIFADRDGIPKAALADIGHERRNGYAWYGSWPRTLLEKDYPAWKARIGGR